MNYTPKASKVYFEAPTTQITFCSLLIKSFKSNCLSVMSINFKISMKILIVPLKCLRNFYKCELMPVIFP